MAGSKTVAPGRVWYVVAVALLVLGLTGTRYFITTRFGTIEAKLTRFVVPGTVELTLEQPGSYTIYHEPNSVVDGRYYAAETVDGLRIRVVSAADNTPLALN